MPAKRQAVIRLVRSKIADGTLGAGAPVPSGTKLAQEAGCSVLTARAAVKVLVDDGTLIPPVSRSGRAKVAHPGGSPVPPVEALARELCQTLAALWRSAGMTQLELAGKLQVSETSVGHAETGRPWQSRAFWLRASGVLGGGLLELHDRYTAARAGADGLEEGELPAAPSGPVWPASVAVTANGVIVTWPGGSRVLVRPPGAEPDGLMTQGDADLSRCAFRLRTSRAGASYSGCRAPAGAQSQR